METIIKEYILKNASDIFSQIMPILTPEIHKIVDQKLDNKKSTGVNALISFTDLVISKDSQKKLIINPEILGKLSEENLAELRVCSSRIKGIIDSAY